MANGWRTSQAHVSISIAVRNDRVSTILHAKPKDRHSHESGKLNLTSDGLVAKAIVPQFWSAFMWEGNAELRMAVRSAKEEQQELEALHRLDEECVYQQQAGNYLKAFDCMERALVLRRHFFGAESPEVLDACKSLAEMCNLLSMSFLQQEPRCDGLDNYAVTIDLLKKAEILTKHHPSEKATTLNNLACYYRRLGKLHAAMTCLKRALEIEEKLQNVRNAADTHLNICAVLSQLGKHQQGLEQAQEALIILQEEFFQSKQTHQNGKVHGSGDAKRSSEECKTSSPSQQLDRVSVMCIAYHNIGVEQEFLKDYTSSVTSYKKGVGLAEQYLGVDHAITTTVRNSYLAAKRTISTKSVGKQMQQTPGADSPGKASTRLLNSPRSGSVTNSLRLPSPLAKEKQRHNILDIPTPRSIIADALSKGSTLPPLDSSASPSRGVLSPRDPFFSPRFRFNDEVESQSPSYPKKKKKEVKCGSPRLEKDPPLQPPNSAAITKGKLLVSESEAAGEMQAGASDMRNEIRPNPSAPVPGTQEETQIEIVANESSEMLQTPDQMLEASPVHHSEQPSNGATVADSSIADSGYLSATPSAPVETRDAAISQEESSSIAADAFDQSSGESTAHNVSPLAIDGSSSNSAMSERVSSDVAPGMDEIGPSALVSESTRAQEGSECANAIAVDSGFTEKEIVHESVESDTANLHSEEKVAALQDTMDEVSPDGNQSSGTECIESGTADIAVVTPEDPVVVDESYHPSEGFDEKDDQYKEDILDVLEESSAALHPLEHDGASPLLDIIDVDLSQAQGHEVRSQIVSNADSSEGQSDIEATTTTGEESLKTTDVNDSSVSTAPGDTVFVKEEENGASFRFEAPPESSELVSAVEHDDAVFGDQAAPSSASLEENSSDAAVDEVHPDRMTDAFAAAENQSHDWFPLSGEHAESSWGVGADYNHIYDADSEYATDGDKTHASHDMGYTPSSGAAESEYYLEEVGVDEFHPVDPSAAESVDSCDQDHGTLDAYYSHEVAASNPTYDNQFDAEVADPHAAGSTVYDDQVGHETLEDGYHIYPTEYPTEPAASDEWRSNDDNPDDLVSDRTTLQDASDHSHYEVNCENASVEVGTADEEASAEYTPHEATISSSQLHDDDDDVPVEMAS